MANDPSNNELLKQGVEVFVRSFGFARSFTHPYLPSEVDGAWVVRDAPRKNQRYRTEEWTSHGISPVKMDKIVRRNARGRYSICAIHGTDESDLPLREGYRALNYRLIRTEPMFVHPLRKIPKFEAPIEMVRVRDQKLADRLAKAAGSRQILPEHLDTDSPLRQYVALDGDQLVGWVRSIVVGAYASVSNMYVEPKRRRKGIARALLAAMLREDRKFGAEASYLLASHAGAMLYPVVGYRQIATLLLFTPKER